MDDRREVPSELSAALTGRYTLIRELGAGGMATVYLAHDHRHDRHVALKVLKPELAAVIGGDRFLREIRITANLQHPNILAVYDSGHSSGFFYYVMPYVEGDTLRTRLKREGRLAPDEAVSLARQIAAGLDYAHRQQLVHRDIKPENILLQEGVPVIADFGIALAVSAAGGERVTQTGFVVGTPTYMSPEQVAGDASLDARSDVYALGCVVHEMLAGRPPFSAPSLQAVMRMHVLEEPPRLSAAEHGISAAAAAAVARALAKEPADRFPSASAFATALTVGTASLTSAVPELETPRAPASIVVLPFANLSPDPDNEYFSDGLTDEVITDLSHVGTLRVIARSSAMRLKNTGQDLRDIGRDLDCRFALEGSVRRAGTSLRVTARLVEIATATQLWADKYTGTVDDVFDMQERVSGAIVTALRLKLSPAEHRALQARRIHDPAARDCYLRARNELWNLTGGGLDRAVRHLQQALELDGDNPLLLRGLGEAYHQFVNTGMAIGREEEYLRKAEDCAARIFAVEPDSPHGHLTLAGPALARGNVHRAAQGYRRGVEAFPHDTGALQGYAHLLGWLAGKPEAAAPLAQRLASLDPLNPLSLFASFSVPMFAGRFGEAVTQARRVFDLDPVTSLYRATLVVALAYDRQTEAAEALTQDVVAQPDSEIGHWLMGLQRAMWRGEHEEVLRLATGPYALAAEWDPELAWTLATAYGSVAETAQALRWLERTIERGMINHPFLSEHDIYLTSVRGTPRFADLMHRARTNWERLEV